MVAHHTHVYRKVVREIAKATVKPRLARNKDIASNFRALFTQSGRPEDTQRFHHDMQNALTFLRSQREYKALLERYNPLIDLTAEERIEATARRVAVSSPETLTALHTAASCLKDLSPVAFPTETVYGLGAIALNATAALKIFSTKGRPADNPLIVHVSSRRMLQTLLPQNYMLSPSYELLIEHFWPGPLTLLFPCDHSLIPDIITAGQPTVAIRMPSHPVARALIAVTDAPLAAPSANSSGKPSPTRAEHVLNDLNGKITIILDGGPCEVGLESTVVDGLHEDGNIRILRPGGITVEDIQRVLINGFSDTDTPIPQILVHRRDFRDDALEQAPTTPGMKYRHYSPSVPVTLMRMSEVPLGIEPLSPSAFLEDLKRSMPHSPNALRVGLLMPSDSILMKSLISDTTIQWREFPFGLVSEPAIIARRLFDGLLTLEREGVDLILVEEVPEENEGLAIMNRVKKAAGSSQWIVIP
ncbi:YwlC protein [Suillus variegatus]|nr:YwlC protein [Suillus variegatus]